MQDQHPRQKLRDGKNKKNTCRILFSSPFEDCKTAEKKPFHQQYLVLGGVNGLTKTYLYFYLFYLRIIL